MGYVRFKEVLSWTREQQTKTTPTQQKSSRTIFWCGTFTLITELAVEFPCVNCQLNHRLIDWYLATLPNKLGSFSDSIRWLETSKISLKWWLKTKLNKHKKTESCILVNSNHFSGWMIARISRTTCQTTIPPNVHTFLKAWLVIATLQLEFTQNLWTSKRTFLVANFGTVVGQKKTPNPLLPNGDLFQTCFKTV